MNDSFFMNEALKLAREAADEGEVPVFAFQTGDYTGSMVIVFENGKAAHFSIESFATKTNRRRLTAAYSDKSPAVAFLYPIDENTEITMFSTAGRALTFRANMLMKKSTRSTQGVQTMVLRAKHTVTRACFAQEAALTDEKRYRVRDIPSIGAILKEEDLPNPQMSL